MCPNHVENLKSMANTVYELVSITCVSGTTNEVIRSLIIFKAFDRSSKNYTETNFMKCVYSFCTVKGKLVCGFNSSLWEVVLKLTQNFKTVCFIHNIIEIYL